MHTVEKRERSGYESIDMLYDMEDSFGITITNKEAEAIFTAGEAFELVLKKLKYGPGPVCFSRSIFKNTVGEFAELGLEDTGLIRPSTPLKDILKAEFISENREKLKSSFPNFVLVLRRPQPLQEIFQALFFAPLISGLAFFVLGAANLISWAVATVGWLVWYVLMKCTEGLCVEIPGELTFRDLAEEQLVSGFPRFLEERRMWNESEVWLVLKKIIAANLGVCTSSIELDSSFTDDLGLVD